MMSETVAGDEEGGRGPRRTWSEEKKDAFIEVLAETCNVRLACDAAGMGTGPAYALKMRDAGFAERWQQALAVGYARVEERLIRDAMGEAGDGEAGSAPMSKYDRELALNLLKFHHARSAGRTAAARRPSGRARRKPTRKSWRGWRR
jgi:hypothetical protein